jgi:hypothetical protein
VNTRLTAHCLVRCNRLSLDALDNRYEVTNWRYSMPAMPHYIARQHQ